VRRPEENGQLTAVLHRLGSLESTAVS
jgi:hypothetical protein